ncbi:uncharacterized protein BP5553_01135 [Venustampulla echinocandica]|uniref:Cupredoxin n=1 Tax=Venustampulla echinocandica TaxID=2656787 RepID=A0A370U051_9HELO|nr:uncharacterized protein BP5553_01135 [Venustampulla echinocandica]RDL41156.1 hypothetical protein BP5553_01135 [Venustampulla echinocandica]
MYLGFSIPMSALLLTTVNCITTLKPTSSFHWNTSNATTQISGASSGYLLATTNTSSVLCPSSTADLSVASLKTHQVMVGPAGNLSFEPSTIDATVGDLVKFTFLAINHTLTQSSLSNPCKENGSFDTGFNQFNPQNVAGRHVVEYRVQNLEPQWFFCAQAAGKSHCKSGMVFGINTGSKMDSFVALATATSFYDSAAPSSATDVEVDYSQPPSISHSSSSSSQLLPEFPSSATSQRFPANKSPKPTMSSVLSNVTAISTTALVSQTTLSTACSSFDSAKPSLAMVCNNSAGIAASTISPNASSSASAIVLLWPLGLIFIGVCFCGL